MGELQFATSSLMRELNTITSNSATPVHFSLTAKLHIGNLTYIPLKVISVDTVRDYESNYADEIMLTLSLSAGMYNVDIYPYKDQIEITLIRTPIGEVSNAGNPNAGIETERYSATLIDTGSAVIEGNTKFTPTKDALDLTNIMEVTFQLVNKAVQQFRLITVGGIYRNTTAGNVVKTIMTNETKKIKVDGVRLPQGVDIVPTFNSKVREHVIIPQGTKLIDVPQYVHHKCGGLYSAGLGYYMQGDYWYVYPCYDITRAPSAKKVLTIINVPPHMFPSIERTYRQDGSNIVILATGEVKYRDNSEVQQLNAGNGVRFANANNFIEGFATTVNNKTTLSRGSNNTEVASVNRANKLNNVPVSDSSINANPFLEYSKLAPRNGATISLVWENSLPSLITPGAMVKIMYINNDTINTINGIVLKAHHYDSLRDKGFISNRYVTRTALLIFCNLVKSGT